MHHDFAISCASAIGPASDDAGRHAYERLKALSSAGRRGVAFSPVKVPAEVASSLSGNITFVHFDAARATPALRDRGLEPRMLYSHSLHDELVDFLRENSIAAIEFPDLDAEGYAFVQHNLVHRRVPAVILRLHLPACVRDDEAGRASCTLHDAALYAAELETIESADHVLYREPDVLERVLACFAPQVAAEIRDRALLDQQPLPPTIPARVSPPENPGAAPIRLGVVIPHLDDADNLETLLAKLHAKPADGDLEIAVVDDGSSSETRRRLDGLRSRYPAVAFLTTPAARSGPFLARRQGLLHLRSDYVAFVDSDDYIEVPAYRDYAGALARFPGLDVILPAMQCFGKETHIWMPPPKARFTVFFTGFAHTGLIGRKSTVLAAYEHAAASAKNIAHSEDCLLAVSMLFLGLKITHVPACAYHYNRTRSDTRSRSNLERIQQSRRARERHVDRCLAEALKQGELTALDLRIMRRLALHLPAGHTATRPTARGNRAAWHTHLYRAFRALLGDPRYSR